eukprot:CFRG5167T1
MSAFGGFGATAPTQAGTTNLFGGQPAAAPATGGLFGSTTQQQSSAAAGSLFGGTSAIGSQFGGSGSSATQPAGNFGSSSAQPAASTGGLFGATMGGGQPATSGGLFGSTTQPAASGGLFGSTTQAAASGGLFGSTAATQPTTGGLFGSKQPTANGGLFGSAQPATSGGLFGASQPASTGAVPAAAPQTVASNDPMIQEINKLKTVYDDSENNPNYRFKFVFYSAIKEEIVSNLGPNDILQDKLTEDANWDDETRQVWTEAKERNPDKRRFIPEVVRGVQLEGKPMDGLTGRLSKQKQRVGELIQYLDMIDHEVTKCHDEHVAMRERIQECKRTQITLAHSCLEAVALLEQQRGRERPMTQQEEQMLVKLQRMKRELNAPTQYAARLLEMQSQARSMKQWIRQNSAPVDMDEEEATAVTKYLSEQQTALSRLSEIVTDDAQDLRLILQELRKYS